MAKPPICASWFPPAAVAAAPWHSAWPISRVSHVQPLGRRGSSPAPICTQVRDRDAFRFRTQKGADHHPGPEPAERDDNDPEAVSPKFQYSKRKKIPVYCSNIYTYVLVCYFRQQEQRSPLSTSSLQTQVPIIQELRKNHVALAVAAAAAAGMREAPDIFRKEKDEISNYMIEIASSSAKAWNVENKVMVLIVRAEAQKALDLASKVMVCGDLTDIASLDVGTTEFSQHTSNQMVRNYASTIRDVAEDAYKKGIKIDNIPSFIDALRGLGVVCSILVQDTAAMLKDGPLKSSISNDMETQSREFDKKLNNLKEEFMVATENKHVIIIKHG
ncbi:hypothetical protein SETIT_5G282800v2 [Setaria italica]|uniref:Uncharacterized protein n=1 Tax=Setaria italica TaxID=4555 RepID=A0A368R9V6_SETIT|nr:hypothetical protein SETIT_5G282800v2 [Setaria italica]